MPNWNEGYTIDIPYDAMFFRELGPDYLRMALLLHGVDLPRRKAKEPLRYLELGYGQGLSLNAYCAAVDGEFWGTDFNADHTLRATELAQSAQLDSRLLNLSFAELDARSAAGDLPTFDIIALHGVWSWITDESRRHILNIIHRNLKMGGAVYVSYNALPGWAPFMPVRELMSMYAESAHSSAANSAERLSHAYADAHRLATAGAGYFSANPSALQRLESLQGKSLNYLVHEYMNRHWRPFYFMDVASALSLAKCAFITSTRLIGQMEVCLPGDTVALLRTAPNPEMRETLRDYSLNQQFRADVFVKGTRRLSTKEHTERMASLRLALACPLESVNLTVESPRGPLDLKEDIYSPVLAALADKAYAPKTLEELEDHPLLVSMESTVLVEAISVLTGAGYVHPAREAKPAQHQACARFNAQMCERACQGEKTLVLASPVLGSAVAINQLEMLLLAARMQDPAAQNKPKEWAARAWNVLAGRGERIVREGQELSAEEGRKQLQELAETMRNVSLPWLSAMQAVPEQAEDDKRA